MTTAREVTALLASGRARARRLHEPSLTRLYRDVLTEQADEAARALGRHALPAAGWYVPDVDELMQRLKQILRTQEKADPVRRDIIRTVADGALARLGIRFDLRNPLVEHLLERMGQNISYVTDTTRRDIMRILSAADARGDGIREAAEAVRSGVRGIALRRARVIARTEFIGAANGASDIAVAIVNDSAKKANEQPVITAKRWLSTGDNRTRPTHRSADGQTVRINDRFSVGQSLMLYPGDPAGSAEEVIQCRCTTLYLGPGEAAGL